MWAVRQESVRGFHCLLPNIPWATHADCIVQWYGTLAIFFYANIFILLYYLNYKIVDSSRNFEEFVAKWQLWKNRNPITRPRSKEEKKRITNRQAEKDVLSSFWPDNYECVYKWRQVGIHLDANSYPSHNQFAGSQRGDFIRWDLCYQF